MANWYVIRGDQERGPFNDSQLKDFAASGKLKPEHQLRRDGSTSVRAAKEIKELFPVTESQPEDVQSENTRSSTPPSQDLAETPIRERLWVIGLALVCFWPVGVFLLWKQSQWKGVEKWRWLSLILVGPMAIFFLAMLIAIVDPEGTKRRNLEVQREREVAARSKAEHQVAKRFDNDSGTDSTAFQVSKGLLAGSIQVTLAPEVADEITISNLTFDGNVTITFILHWRKGHGRRIDPWRFSTYDKDGIKLDQFKVGIPDTISLGEKVKGRMVMNSRDVSSVTRIEIHK